MKNNLLKYLSNSVFNNIKRETNLYKKSYDLVTILFKDKVDKNNIPYITHLIRVSSKMSTLEGRVAGLLHDVVEDIDGVTFEDLIDIGIPDNIIEVLKLVTKKEHEKNISKSKKLELYNEEIDNIINSNNEIAIELKYSDMSDNFNKERLKLLSEDKQKWLTLKYEKNIKKLEKVRRIENDRY